jgi:metal-sulfur cluster biosynthetic enzyme
MDRELLLDALRGVYDPCCADRGVSIVDMGVVEDVRHAGGHVEVHQIPTTGGCPFVVNISTAIPEAL